MQWVEQSEKEVVISGGGGVEQKDSEASLRRVWHTRMRLSEREEKNGQ